jgi:hypothetical protein
MTALGTLALELAVADPDRSPTRCALAALGMLVAPAIVVAWYFGRRASLTHSKERGGPTPLAVAMLLALFGEPFVLEAGRLLLFGRSAMPEVVLLSGVRNLGLGLATLSHRPVCARLAAVISLFLTLVATSLGEGRLIAGLVGLYAVAGTSWLMLAYWGRVVGADARGDRRVPARALAGVAGVVVTLAAVLAIGPADAALVLAGVMPTSGGTLWNDPDARGGVNDGDNEVAASERPESVGFTQSEIYLDTDRPSLYDAFNETYGEPYKPREMQRMIALGTSDVREQGERPSENLRAGREFALVRRKPQRPGTRPGERAAQALVYVKGPTPLHMALLAYDRFDGRTWREEPPCRSHCPLELEPDRSWFRLEAPPCAFHAGIVSHQVKIGTLDSGALPLPAHVARFRVGSVNRADFFGWAQQGILRMLGRTVPAGTVIESEARPVVPRRLADVAFPPFSFASSARLSGLDEGYEVDPGVAVLARGWARGIPEGWPQVEAIVAALRRHATLDRDAALPADCRDAVAHFLLHARRGPDVQFATAAVVLLRSLGYPARVVSGLYAGPERYDPRTRHTPVTREDVHFWAEVILPGGPAVAIEPTPGYRLMEPRLPWAERIAAALGAAWAWAVDHPGVLGSVLLGLAAALRFRREALDVLATATWAITSRRDWRGCVLATLRLLERRSSWVGHPRPPSQTLARWYGPITASAGEGGEARDEFGRLIRLADWALYAHDGSPQRPPWDEREIRSTCRHVVRAWTLGRFRAATRPRSRKVAAL